MRWRSFAGSPAEYVMRNSMASLLLWTIPAACLAIALWKWDDSMALQIAAAAFGISYILCYRRLVRFGVPSWPITVNPPPWKDAAAPIRSGRAAAVRMMIGPPMQ